MESLKLHTYVHGGCHPVHALMHATTGPTCPAGTCTPAAPHSQLRNHALQEHMQQHEHIYPTTMEGTTKLLPSS
eukprot:2381991-Amphidinium_carterae.2